MVESGFLMLLYKNRIVVTGGSGRFGQELNKINTRLKIFYPKKRELDILSISSIKKYLTKKKPKYLIHLAGLSRPMKIHEKLIKKSIDLNIIGTANITKICYGRKVGYKFEKINLDKKTQQISATKIREQMRKDGKL